MEDPEIPDFIKISGDIYDNNAYNIIERYYIGNFVEIDYSECKQKVANINGILEKITLDSITIVNNCTIYSKRIFPEMIIKLKK